MNFTGHRHVYLIGLCVKYTVFAVDAMSSLHVYQEGNIGKGCLFPSLG